jgi:hypothetical protein|tara:strand:+ start:4000 stop:5010 length:1011 start_codon:yes stop_codon:yes gene_type:complete
LVTPADTVSTTEAVVDSPSVEAAEESFVASDVSEAQVYQLGPDDILDEETPAESPEEDQPVAVASEPEATDEPEETASEPAAEEPAEEVASPVNIRDTEEFRNLQASADRQIAAAQAEARQVAAQAAEAASQQVIETQVEAHRRDLATFYDQQGLTPDMYAQRVAEAGDNLAGRLRSEAQAEQLNEAQTAQQQQVVQQNQNAAMGMLTAFTKDLTEKHNLSEPIETALNKVAAFGVTRISEFQDANNALSPEFSYLGEAIAEIAAEAGKVASSRAETASAEAKKSVVPAGGPENQLDSGGSQSGSQSDAQFMADYAAGRSDDTARAIAIQQKRGNM